jgi:hypothetical protein
MDRYAARAAVTGEAHGTKARPARVRAGRDRVSCRAGSGVRVERPPGRQSGLPPPWHHPCRAYGMDAAAAAPLGRVGVVPCRCGEGARIRCHSGHGAYDCVTLDPSWGVFLHSVTDLAAAVWGERSRRLGPGKATWPPRGPGVGKNNPKGRPAGSEPVQWPGLPRDETRTFTLTGPQPPKRTPVTAKDAGRCIDGCLRRACFCHELITQSDVARMRGGGG